MKAIKLNLIIFLLALTGSITLAETKASQAIIQQLSEDLISVKAEVCNSDQMKVEITNKDGDVVFSDKLSGANGFASKTYDLSETRVGEYFISVYCNDRILETTVIADGKVAIRDNFYFVLN